MNGTIIKGIGGFYYIKADDDNIYECKARGKFRKDGITPMIGDEVTIEVSGDKGSIEEIKERRTFLVRPSVANIDTMLLVVAASAPEPNLQLIDKMLINAAINNIKSIICINKIDLKNCDDIIHLYANIGYEVIAVSAYEKFGIDKLFDVLKGKVTAFAGLSGVGKSSILNLITDTDMETGLISEKIQRGRHTTRHVELIELPQGGFVFDTPGFSSLEIQNIKAEELQNYFPEILRVDKQCKYRGCAHINEPECSVKKHFEEGKIAPSRYESYKELYNYLKEIKEWQS